MGSDIDLIVRDKASGGEMVIDLTTFPASTRLRKIKAGLLSDLAARDIQAQVHLHVR